MNVNKLITKSVISDYTPSQVNDYYTLLEQLEFIKQLLQKYPSTQFFYTTQSYSSSATTMAQSRITLNGRTIAVGDFIFSTITNTKNQLGLWQVTGFSGTAVNVQFIGNLAEQGTVTAGNIYNLLEGSDTIVADLNEEGTAVELHLDNEVLNDITNSLKKPLYVGLDHLVGVTNDNGNVVQKNVTIGDGLQIKDKVLTSKSYNHVIKYNVNIDGIGLNTFFNIINNSNTPFTVTTIPRGKYFGGITNVGSSDTYKLIVLTKYETEDSYMQADIYSQEQVWKSSITGIIDTVEEL